MTQKQIDKWLRRRFSPVCWILIGYFVLMNLLVWTIDRITPPVRYGQRGGKNNA